MAAENTEKSVMKRSSLRAGPKPRKVKQKGSQPLQAHGRNGGKCHRRGHSRAGKGCMRPAYSRTRLHSFAAAPRPPSAPPLTTTLWAAA